MKTFAEKAYRYTKLDFVETQRRINEMLQDINITSIRYTQENDFYTVEFLVKLYENEGQRKVRINIPCDEEFGGNEKKNANRKNQLFRVLLYNLKNRFVSVANGLKEFDEEFLSDLVIMHEGKEVRVGDIIAPKYRELLGSGQSVPVLHIN